MCPGSFNASLTKRDGTEVGSPGIPPRAIHGRLSQLDTQPDPPALDPRLSQANTVAAPTLDDPDLSETLKQVQASCWVTGSFTDPPLPDVPQSPFSARGNLPLPEPALVSGPALSVQVVNSDIFARARMAAVQS